MAQKERGVTGSFGTWLAGLSREELAGLLTERPDATADPEPSTLGELAERLSGPHGVMAAFAACDLPLVQFAEALAALGGTAPRSDAEALLGAAPDDFARVLDALVRRGLVWPADGLLHLAETLGEWPIGDGPLGLGPSAAVLLPHLRAEDLRRIVRGLGVEPPGKRKAELLEAALAGLSDAERVRRVVAAAPQQERRLIEKVARAGRVDDYQGIYLFGQKGPYAWALARGLLVQPDWLEPLMPAEVALALRGPSYQAPFTPAAPSVGTAAAPEATVTAEFGAASARAVEQMEAVLRSCASEPPTRLKSGGLGVRELRRTAKRTGGSEDAVRLWLELAAAEGLLDWRDGALVPTAKGGDPLPAAERLASMVRTWAHMPRLPLLDDPEEGRGASLDTRAYDPAAPRLRAAVLGSLASLPGGRGATGPEQLVAAVTWRSPLLFEDAELAPPYIAAVWQEAELLGVLAHGALTATGRVLAGAEAQTTLDEAAVDALEAACGRVLLQGDLTAVVPGPPAPWLAVLLDLVADRESRGTASVWRFGLASVRRALDAGRSAEGIRSDLEAAAGTDLPQPLAYLIDDVARRHGEVTVTALACAICCSRPALLAEILAHRGLRRLKLRELAPTVLASAEPVDQTLMALRAAGYVPVGAGDTGALLIERAPARPSHRPARPSRRGRRPAGKHEASRPRTPIDLADRLHGTSPDLPAETDGVGAGMADLAPHLSVSERRMLVHAVRTGTAVGIDYVNAEGNPTTRVIEKIRLDAPFLTAWCRLRDDERVFRIGRVQAVTPAVLMT
ncbi:helicase C-terminal domain-containing protein [Actinomadura sp. 3N407]|uniref:helicase C-terminal domain-containing protein n=1 Tax=Actinomadura sp. 3N407 TaxID=3457423 RepID=UPI003FCD3286